MSISTKLIPSPAILSATAENVSRGAAIPQDKLAELLTSVATQWQADQEKIRYLESLLLRK